MFKKLIILWFSLCFLLPSGISAQEQTTFSGDKKLFGEELIRFMGPNLTPEQTANLNRFLIYFDSSYFNNENQTKIIDIAIQFQGRTMRAVPNFNNLFITLNSIVDSNSDPLILSYWLSSLEKISLDLSFSNNFLDRYVYNFGKMITGNILFESTSGTRWKIKNSRLSYTYDSIFCVNIENATLACFTQRDSTEIYNVNGIYLPSEQIFHGSKGKVTFEKAGLAGDEVFVDIGKFDIDVTKNSFVIDSVLLTHQTYFREPVYGKITDQAITFKNKENATFPRFETYEKQFVIENIYEGVSYDGGLSFEGANVKGKGDIISPASITLFRNDTLYLKVTSTEFLFSPRRVAGSEAAMVLYLDKDSIYHGNLSFSYNTETRQVNMFRANNPISKGPYYDSFHNLDMYFELLSWDMDSSDIIMSKSIGAAQGSAEFESSSFFNENYYLGLQGIDEYHPLVRLQRFAEWYYSETFPVEEFASWLNKPVETVTGLCIDMANKGFIFYDRNFNVVTLKQKTHDYVNAFLKRQDYDAIIIESQVGSNTDNAVLNLNNYRLTVNGVSNIFLSTAQNVRIRPRNNSIEIGENRRIEFDGVVDAGLFTVHGNKFSFNYDTFMIRLQSIDSIKIAVESDQYDAFGNPLIKEIDNLIQLGSAEIFIDDPLNKSGLRNMEQYPIISSTTYSYIFYDKIPELEGIYPRSDVYFRIYPFTYENIDHYKNEDMNLAGEFIAQGIIEPIEQRLTIQEDNSLGFNMAIPEEGLAVYNSRGRLFNSLSINNRGLVGNGALTYLTSTTISEEFKFFPDSMTANATNFSIDGSIPGQFPSTFGEDISIKWYPENEEFLATNSIDKDFEMFDNGTTFDGRLIMTPTALRGEGGARTTDSRIYSESFNFSSNSILADTSIYNLMSPSSDGYAFIANNVSTDINFESGVTKFHLNTDTSMVIFPEIMYMCTMTDFTYDMDSKIMDMEQQTESVFHLLAPEELINIGRDQHHKATFFSTNRIDDTISFYSSSGKYYLNEEYITAQNINYIPIADALIQPEDGEIRINRRASIEKLQNAIVAINNNHILHSASINIESTSEYAGSGIYDYLDINKTVQEIAFPEITVDTLHSSAIGYIAASEEFMLSPAFGYQGDVTLFSNFKDLSFTGAASVVHNCGPTSYPVKFKSFIDPGNVMIPISDKPRDINDELVFSGSFLNIDSTHIYPAFLSAQKSWTDAGLIQSEGYLWYDRTDNSYLIASKDKIADRSISGNIINFDTEECTISGEGDINFGSDYDLVYVSQAGNYEHQIDSGTISIHTMMAFDFYFSEEALEIMASEFRMIPTLKAVDINNEFYKRSLTDLIGVEGARTIETDLGLYGTLRNIPSNFDYEIVLNDVNLYWDESNSSYRSEGPIGIGFVGTQPMNIYVDGYIEIQRRRTGDMFDIYLKADNSTWYYFSYIRGNMMTQSSNNNYNIIISTTKLNKRKHPDSSVRQPYSYMISVEDRLPRFIRRMEETTDYEQVQDNPIDF